jgi:hypothetical protein
MHNESDALDILAMAALGGRRGKSKGKSVGRRRRERGEGNDEDEDEEVVSSSREGSHDEDGDEEDGDASAQSDEGMRPPSSRWRRDRAGPGSTTDLPESIADHQDHRRLSGNFERPPRPSTASGTKAARQKVRIGWPDDVIPNSDDSDELAAAEAAEAKPADLSTFLLVEQGIADEEQVVKLCRAFFKYHHHIFVRDLAGAEVPSCGVCELTRLPFFPN